MTKIDKVVTAFAIVVLSFIMFFLYQIILDLNTMENSHYLIRSDKNYYYTDNYTEENDVVKFHDKITDRDVVLRGYDSIETR